MRRRFFNNILLKEKAVANITCLPKSTDQIYVPNVKVKFMSHSGQGLFSDCNSE